MDELPSDPRIERAVARYREALTEIARLAIPDDHGAGMRTVRLAGIGWWEIEAERVRGELEQLTGESWPPERVRPPRGTP